MRAARSTASSSVAGLPSIRATGRSSTWWLRNQALPSTQAFFALVMWSPSTVSSMSSQTQPQKVQVALETTFNSVGSGIGAILFVAFPIRGGLDLRLGCVVGQELLPGRLAEIRPRVAAHPAGADNTGRAVEADPGGGGGNPP